MILGTVAKLERCRRGRYHGDGGILRVQRDRVHVDVQQIQPRLGTKDDGRRRRVQRDVACR